MIDKSTENIYNIILSIFLGIIFVILIDQCFEKPRIFDIYVDKPRIDKI
jgi:hypothetical protein